MSKFKVVKRLTLEFLGEGWQEAYIDFQAISVMEIRDKFPALAKIDPKDIDDVSSSFDTILNTLKEKFIGGKAPGDKGELVDLKAEDIDELPAEIITRALSFLSQTVA